MKLHTLILAAALALPVALPAAAGELAQGAGKIFSGENYMVVKKELPSGGRIERHNHSGFQTLLFTAVKGRFKVVLNDKETHEVGAGETLRFAGADYIEAEAVGESTAVITLVK